jgi:hypothetical protein
LGKPDGPFIAPFNMTIPRLDKTRFAVARLGQEPPPYLFWLAQPPSERIGAVELYRQWPEN